MEPSSKATIAIFSTPDPIPVIGPSSATPRLKMVGNMIELNKPMQRMLHIAACPRKIMEAVTNDAATTAQNASRCPGL